MVTVAGCLEKGETMKKRKIMFAAVIVVFCLVIFVVTRQPDFSFHSWNDENVFGISDTGGFAGAGKLFRQEIKKPVFSGQGSVISYSAKNKNLSKEKDPKYSPEDLGLWDTQILFRWDNDTKNILYWSDYQDDKTGLFTWGAVDGDDIKSYYLDKKYALKLQKLFIKYTGKNEKTFPKNSQDS